MARISLRAYHQDIESLIERGLNEEAIDHCRYILQFFPKHIDTYRLLGKAYLESQRYGDAADIFQRILSSVPDDFVAHIGMSLIREDEGNLEAATWHMERAGDTQPSNQAIQSELRRLYARRDGYEPPRVRITRGGLARMYLKGKIYSQAITELRAALTEDPERVDLQVTLARAYMLADQRVEAAETCSAILQKLPYCLEANRILAEILKNTERAAKSQAYLNRVHQLDPYSAFLSEQAPTPDKVPDDAVILDKLDWKPGISLLPDTRPDWALSAGIEMEDLDADQGDLPDWLADFSGEEKPSIPPFTTPSSSDMRAKKAPPPMDESNVQKPDDLIPDFMKSAGWKPAGEDSPADSQPPDEDELGEELAPAEIPEWLQSLAPEDEQPDSSPQTGEDSPPELDVQKLETDLEEALSSPASAWLADNPPGPTDSVVTWLHNNQPVGDPASEPQPADDEELPEWIATIGGEADSGTGEEALPDWLSDLAPTEGASEGETLASVPGGGEEGRPQGLTEKEGFESQVEIMNTDHEEQALPEEPAAQPEASEVTPQESKLPVDEPQVVAETDGELDQDHEEPSAPAPEAAAVEETASISDSEETSIDLTGDDDAFAWLEGLAARQGAEEALLLDPDERRETPPDWVQAAIEESESKETPPEPAPAEAPLEPAMASAAESDEVPEWLPEDATQPTTAETPSEPAFVSEDEDTAGQEWLPESAVQPTADETLSEQMQMTAEVAEFPAGEEAPEEPAMLSFEESEEGAAETPEGEAAKMEEPVASQEIPETSVQDEELPAWLLEADMESFIPEVEEAPLPESEMEDLPVAEKGELPPWVQELAPPSETPPDEGKFLSLDEGPLIEGDTKPSRLTLQERAPSAPEEIRAEEEGEPIESGEVPEWLQELAPEMEVVEETSPTEETADEAPPIIESLAEDLIPTAEADLETTADEVELPSSDQADLPQWLSELGQQTEEALQESPAVEDDLEQGEIPQWLQDLAPEDIETPIDQASMTDVSPLESEQFEEVDLLAESLTSPDEDVPGEAEALAESAPPTTPLSEPEVEEIAGVPGMPEAALSPEPPPAESEAPATPEFEPAAPTEPPVEPEEEEVVAEMPESTVEADIPPEPQPETEAADMPVSAEIPAVFAAETEEQPEVEDIVTPSVTMTEEELPHPETPAAEVTEAPALEEQVLAEESPAEEPELPEWLAGIEEEVAEPIPEAEWQPSAEEIKQVTGTPETPVEFERLDLNAASLVDLERLPGVGFVRAQALLDYVQSNGPLQSVDELNAIPGFTPELIEELKPQVKVAPVPAEAEPEVEVQADEHELTLLHARNDLIQGDSSSALEKYNRLIQAREHLPEVIRDLNEALYRFPVDIPLWIALGDAHARSGQLQDALDAYTKAEELLS